MSKLTIRVCHLCWKAPVFALHGHRTVHYYYCHKFLHTWNNATVIPKLIQNHSCNRICAFQFRTWWGGIKSSESSLQLAMNFPRILLFPSVNGNCACNKLDLWENPSLVYHELSGSLALSSVSTVPATNKGQSHVIRLYMKWHEILLGHYILVMWGFWSFAAEMSFWFQKVWIWMHRE